MILDNTLRRKLDAGEPTIGTHVLFNDPDIAEIVGDTGLFDYAEFDAEYSVLDMNALYHLARAGQCGNLPLMIKPDQEGQGFWTQAAMGAGFKAVLFTDIRSVEDVDECHRIVAADTPAGEGHMGVKLRRPALTSYDTDAYLKDLESFVVAIMIEKNITVADIDAVLERARSRGVDMVQWGPADFGFSRGQPALMSTPQIRPFEELVIGKALEYEIHPRIEIGAVDQARRYLDLGVRHFCIGWDRFIYRAAITQLGEGMQKLMEKA
ncbi:MAG: aldolase/citrate lyase family protein [Pseudomonadales bacterium]|nr:aldolase/citrate lyase family protein [Pseudomonadales bacterium]MDP6473214.1 aldolase/citrate lyase family protein [Pseudomonadales bacterium]MDP6826026.1 aldolase/citrate lyase family protein [Pseudomonadales bacterium]MDP6970745.1 aldolase/citrate lyase family protein [Pseudomonadales bacterium]